jgi:4-hydroxy-tetrahydrodipicolinate synthase
MAGTPGRFGAVLTAMVTPFREDGALDLDGAATLARWLADNGSDGLVIAGTTGESPVLTDPERLDLIAAVAEAVTIPVIAGTTTNDTAHSVDVTQKARTMGIAGVLAVTPYYNRPGQSGLEGHFRAVAEAAGDLPVLLYDIPIRTGRKIAHETLLKLGREVANIVGVKDAAGDPYASARLLAEAPDGFELYSGDDGMTLPLLAVGGVGVVSVASHWTGTLQGQMVAAFFKGDVDEARRTNARLLPSFVFETGDRAPNPIPTKAVMRVLGLPSGQCRLPMGLAPDGLEDEARAILADLGADAPRA